MSKLPDTSKQVHQSSRGSFSLYEKFEALAEWVDGIIGTPYWFAFSLFLILVWIPSGLIVGYGEIWHLMINTTTTILTFIMMALLHASESRWEARMEKMEESQRVTLEFLKKETERIAALEEAHMAGAEPYEQKVTTTKEHISSLN